jgi:uncharacterized protein (DUF1501 family)
MAGGNDGMSMVVPYADERYYALRRRTAIAPSDVLRLDGQVGLHPKLSKIASWGPAVIAGVGVARPDLSHFEMLRRWWTADPAGDLHPATGFLGRLCDAIGDPAAPAVGLSLGAGPTPALDADRVVTLSVDPSQGVTSPLPGDGGTLDRAWVAAQRAMAHPDRADGSSLAAARIGSARSATFGDLAARLSPAGDGYPKGDTAAQLQLAARLLSADQGIRVVHVPLTGDFDTHSGHPLHYAKLMADLDDAVDAFLRDLQVRQLTGRVLVATVSEFGRRAGDNGDDGLDHGTVSNALLLGPVRPGLHGELPHLDRLDDDGNAAATVPMLDYYATLAEAWLGVPAAEVLPSGSSAIAGVISAP